MTSPLHYVLYKDQWYTVHGWGNRLQFCQAWVVATWDMCELQLRHQERELILLSKVKMRSKDSFSTSRTEVNVELQSDYNYNPESPKYPNSNLKILLIWNQATMPIDNQYEDVNGATNFKKDGDSRDRSVKCYWQVKGPPEGSLPRHAPRSLPRVNQDSTEVANLEQQHEVNQIIFKADFERWLPS